MNLSSIVYVLHVKLLKVISQSSSLLKHCFFERVQTSAFKNCERRRTSSWDVLPLNLEMMSALYACYKSKHLSALHGIIQVIQKLYLFEKIWPLIHFMIFSLSAVQKQFEGMLYPFIID